MTGAAVVGLAGFAGSFRRTEVKDRALTAVTISPVAGRSSALPMKLVYSSLLLRPWMAKDCCRKIMKVS